MPKVLAPVWNYLLGKGYSIKTSSTPSELIADCLKTKITITANEEFLISLVEVDENYYKTIIAQVKNSKLRKEPKISKINNLPSRIIAITLKNEANGVVLVDGDEYINWLTDRKEEKNPKDGSPKKIKEKNYVIELTKITKPGENK